MMKTTTCFAVAMFAITINCLASGSNAQPMSSSSSTHSGSCAGGCNHGSSSDSIELIPYGQAGYTAMRRSFPSQQMSSYGRSDMMSDRSGYVPQFLNSTPYRANQRPDYQGSPSMQYDRRGRQNYDTRRENFTYANETDSGYSYRGNRMPGGCPGGCSHDGRRDSYDSQRYERGGQSGLERGSQYRNEADRVPQLGMYPPVRRQQSAAYYGQTPSKRLLQMRQEYGSPQTQGGVGMSSQEAFSQIGPPPSFSGNPSGSGSYGCDHAGCNHDHN